MAVDKRPYPIDYSPLQRKWDIQTIPLKTSVDMAFDAIQGSALARDKGYAERVLIIHPSLRECERIYHSIRDRSKMFEQLTGRPFKIAVVHAGDRRIPADGHIVATQMVDSGVTIKGVSCVIDCMLSTVSHKGTVQMINSTETTSIQRKGRTGRTNNGLYIPLHKPSSRGEPITLPNAWDLMVHFEVYRPIYEGTINLSSLFVQVDSNTPGLRINKFAVFTGPEDLFPDALTRLAYLRDLAVYLQILLLFTNEENVDKVFKECNRLYDRLVNGYADDATEHFVQKGIRPEVASSRFQADINADRIQWNTLVGLAPGLPKICGNELMLGPYYPNIHPAAYDKHGIRIGRDTGHENNDCRQRLEVLLAGKMVGPDMNLFKKAILEALRTSHHDSFTPRQKCQITEAQTWVADLKTEEEADELVDWCVENGLIDAALVAPQSSDPATDGEVMWPPEGKGLDLHQIPIVETTSLTPVLSVISPVVETFTYSPEQLHMKLILKNPNTLSADGYKVYSRIQQILCPNGRDYVPAEDVDMEDLVAEAQRNGLI
jgi:hypothetical protein